jgi:TP901 family phage tail tape measure protein
MAATEQVMILLRAKDEASHIIDGVGGKLNGLAGIAQSAVMAAGAAAVAAVAGITTAIGVGVNKAMDMEQQLADIASVMNITAAEAAPLKELISQLGVDPNLKVSANEAADAIQMLARNGLSMTEILDGAAHSTVLLANATNADFAVAADIATDVMALFNIQAADMSTAVNGITSVTTSSKFAIDDYRLALAQGGGVAAAAGVTFADFNTTIAAISPYFASGSDAGTSFKVMIQRLIPTSKDAEAAMKDLGLMTAEGANQFFNADGSMRSMAEIAGLLQGALGNLTEEQKNAALSTIFGTDAMRAAVGLAEVGSEQFDALAASMAAIDAEAMAATRMDTLSGALEILQGIIDGVLMQIGDQFLPVLRNLATWAITFADQHGAAIVAWFGQLAQWINQVAPLVSSWAQVTIQAIGEVLNWLRGGPEQFTQLRAIWGQVTQIISGVIMETINYVRSHWSDWVAVLLSWGELFGSWATNLWNIYLWPGLREVWQNMRTWLDENGNGIGTATERWTGAFADMVRTIRQGWSMAWPEIANIVADAAGNMSEDLTRLLNALNKIFGWFSGGEGSAAASSWSEFFTNLVAVASVPLAGLVHVIANIVEMVAMLGDLFGALRDADWGNAGDIARQIAATFGDTVWTALSIPGGIWDAIQGRAAGGPVDAGKPYFVGEQGMELFVPDSNGTIIPNNQTSNIVNNNYNLSVVGNGDNGGDAMAALRLASALYGA